mmetsp:Transcript_107183/g.277274  ORF Transcript_107183/g.277274 Transcript_107183/m.277274 type:complete len:215 (+) Transcript_107183:2262-2906(+)
MCDLLPLLVDDVHLARGVRPLDEPLLDLRRPQVEHHQKTAKDRKDEEPREHATDDVFLGLLEIPRIAVHGRVDCQEATHHRCKANHPLRPSEGLMVEDGADDGMLAHQDIHEGTYPKGHQVHVPHRVRDWVVHIQWRGEAISIVVVPRLHLVFLHLASSSFVLYVAQDDEQHVREKKHAERGDREEIASRVATDAMALPHLAVPRCRCVDERVA